jgi:hypothetical protein
MTSQKRPFELFPRTEQQAKYTLIILVLLFLIGVVGGGTLYGFGILRLFSE